MHEWKESQIEIVRWSNRTEKRIEHAKFSSISHAFWFLPPDLKVAEKQGEEEDDEEVDKNKHLILSFE